MTTRIPDTFAVAVAKLSPAFFEIWISTLSFFDHLNQFGVGRHGRVSVHPSEIAVPATASISILARTHIWALASIAGRRGIFLRRLIPRLVCVLVLNQIDETLQCKSVVSVRILDTVQIFIRVGSPIIFPFLALPLACLD